jgi:pimeloyl-ACP methyl ester carboxylesterase
VTWHAHYYVQRHLMPCSQKRVLARIADSLFRQRPYAPNQLIAALRQDLAKVPLLHSICHLESLPQGGVNVPLMVCGAENDSVVYPAALTAWAKWFKLGDRQYLCPDGGHFFHYSHPDELAQEILGFWQSQVDEP